jgi:hypothetical protein
LKDFLISCLSQFKIYIWLVTWCYNIDKYLDKIKEKKTFLWIHWEFLDKSHAKKMIIFSLVSLRSWFSIKTLMFSSWNFSTHMLGTFCLLMIPHINFYLMIHVVLYFWNHLKVRVVIGITCSPPFFLTWSCFTCLSLMFKLTWNLILLGLLEA